MTLNEINSCAVCHNNDLIRKRVIIDGEKKEIKICKDCETIHYIKHNTLFYEFSVKINIHSGIEIKENYE